MNKERQKLFQLITVENLEKWARERGVTPRRMDYNGCIMGLLAHGLGFKGCPLPEAIAAEFPQFSVDTLRALEHGWEAWSGVPEDHLDDEIWDRGYALSLYFGLRA